MNPSPLWRDELSEVQRSDDRTGECSLRDVVRLRAFAFDLPAIGSPNGHAPKRITDFGSSIQQSIRNAVIIAVQGRQLRTERDARRPCQRRDVDEEIGVLAVGIRERIAKNQAPFGIRVADFDRLAASGVHDIERTIRVAGKRQVGTVYVTNYSASSDWHLVPAWLDGREVLAVFHDPRDARPAYFIEVTLVERRVAAIHDFRYVPYIGQEAPIELRDPAG
jgi:hypothetical protein